MSGATAQPLGHEATAARIGELLERLFVNPKIEQIHLRDDSRFQWLLGKFPWPLSPDTMTLKASLTAWQQRASHREQLADLLQHLIEYTTALSEEMLEDELFGIVTPLFAGEPKTAAALLAWLGWDGRPRRILDEAGESAEVTRLRVRQQKDRLQRRLARGEIWTPVLDRGLAVVCRRAPVPAKEVGPLLHGAGLSDLPTFDASGLLLAQQLFHRQDGLTLVSDRGTWQIIGPAQPAASAMPPDLAPAPAALPDALVTKPADSAPPSLRVAYTTLRDEPPVQESEAVRRRMRQAYDLLARDTGIVELSALLEYLREHDVMVDRYRLPAVLTRMAPLTVLAGGWVAAIADKRQSILTKRLRQLLAVRPSLAVSVIRRQLIRACSTYDRLPVEVLQAFATAHPEFQLTGHRLSSRTTLLPKQELDEGELFVFGVLGHSAKPLTADEVVAVTKGRRRLGDERVRQALRTSVIVADGDGGRYALVKDEVAPARAMAMSNPAASTEQIGDGSPSALAPVTQISLARARRVAEPPPDARVEEATTPLMSDVTIAPVRLGTTSETYATVAELVRRVREEAIVLPEIQRDYVWKRTQVRDLLDSLYRDYPIGTMLLWNTDELPVARTMGDQQQPVAPGGDRQYLLDGQQRLTSLSRVMNDGDPDIRFNLETEEFRVANATTRSDPRWIKVTDVFTRGSLPVLRQTGLLNDQRADLFSERINRLRAIGNRRVVLNQLTNFSYEDVTEIFIRVNSKGTRLRTAELAIAQLAFRLPGLVTDQLRGFAERLAETGWAIDPRLLLRCLTAVATDQVTFPGLSQATETELQEAWPRTQEAVDAFLLLIEERLGIQSVEWLASTQALVIPVVYLSRTKPGERDEHGLLRWFLLANVRGRYSAASETALAQDLHLLSDNLADPFPKLIERIRAASGRLTVTTADLAGARQGSPLFLLSFLAARAAGARDWWTGDRLTSTNLGPDRLLALHQIFLKGALGRGYDRNLYNEIANLVFLSQPAPRAITMGASVDYLAQIPADRLRQQCVPERPSDWHPDRFAPFLKERRRLLAAAMNEVLTAAL